MEISDLKVEPNFDIKLEVQMDQHLKVPFCKKQFILERIRYAGPKTMGMFAEKITEAIYPFQQSATGKYDYDSGGKRVEVKSSRSYTHRDRSHQMASLRDLDSDDGYDCNIQQIKPELFDWLYYMVFCEDGMQMFKIKSRQISAAGIGYSNSQHHGNVGEGQFHINKNTYRRHLKYIIQDLSYDELYDILKKQNKL